MVLRVTSSRGSLKVQILRLGSQGQTHQQLRGAHIHSSRQAWSILLTRHVGEMLAWRCGVTARPPLPVAPRRLRASLNLSLLLR